jgi:SAM-dependent methyltransferase
MKRGLIADLQCPYCGGAFDIAAEMESDHERLRWGLLRCRCFEFPIVDGVLLLSLAKGYGGPEEEVQPYVPLQVAAITYLKKQDVPGLREWMRRHMPLAAELLDGGPEQPYLTFSARLGAELDARVDAFLEDVGRYEVLGKAAAPKPSTSARLRNGVRTLRKGLRKARPSTAHQPGFAAEIERLHDYYASRFYSPRANALALRLATLPFGARVLSLCCGHGIFENLLRALEISTEPVSMDGQFINLLVTRRYANRSGSFILHDVQFPLPFRDGTFASVFSSTCLPEIPAQKTFAEQAIRVTAPTGWTFFDGIWNLESGVQRVNPDRHYRFCQNFFARLEDYVSFFHECAGVQRQIGIDIPRPTADYRDSGRWMFEPGEIDARLALKDALEISVLVVDPRQFIGFVPAAPLAAMRAERLSVSPAYKLEDRAGTDARYARRPQFAKFDAVLASKRFGGYPERLSVKAAQLEDPAWLFDQFCAATVVFLPPKFLRESTPIKVQE